MPSQSNPYTLFHLVPVSQFASQALLDPTNKPFVSPSRDGRLGLEVGYNVPSMSRPNLITTLGQDADLNLRMIDFRYTMAKVHATFEFNPRSGLVVLSVQSKAISSVSYVEIPKTADGEKREETASLQQQIPKSVNVGESYTGGGVILYDHEYEIVITSYRFRLLWLYDSAESEIRARRGYQESLRQLFQYDHVEYDTTRLSTTREPHFEEIKQLRETLNLGAYDIVTKRVDRRSGDVVAVKQPRLEDPKTSEIMHDYFCIEIENMEGLIHPNIIPLLGHRHLYTRHPEILMPFREGHLGDLAPQIKDADMGDFCGSVLKQMLAALDYTASEGVIHRDLKPSNILFYRLPDRLPGKSQYHFQLADFRLAQYTALAESLYIGTLPYMAPEVCPKESEVRARQSPKVDIWSLFATIVAIDRRFPDFPPKSSDYAIILNALQKKDVKDLCGPMGRRNPRSRASAAQMLRYFFYGEGLTTPISEISQIEPAYEVDETDETDETELPSIPVTRSRGQTENDDGSTFRQANVAALEWGSALRTENNSDSTVQQPSQCNEDYQASTQSRRAFGSVASTNTNRQNNPPYPKPPRSLAVSVGPV
ncbi:hypothetical protein O1611_g7714 [Lasiodiplodia mahajangana]|uniref:Uncharacterized protein n=1 Tax=Lasiodiplodia mahajangana TaxID=1108764 RepID=A0ACC2JEZ6_9PEZI|nr:hypothetical protein O1611_g7714 [Lasiodiplodia mahajangana]